MTAYDASTPSALPDRRTVAGIFQNPADAESALNALRDEGFTPDQVSVVARDQRDVRSVTVATGMGAEGTSTGTGALLGGITGGVIGWLIGVGALAIPGIGPIVAAGALATTLGGAAVGAIAGGLIGALVGMGVPEEDARAYESSVKGGGILLVVHARDDDQSRDAHRIFDRSGGADVRAYGLTDAALHAERREVDRSREAASGALAGAATGAVAGAALGGPAGAVVGGVGAAAVGAVAGARAATPEHDRARAEDVRGETEETGSLARRAGSMGTTSGTPTTHTGVTSGSEANATVSATDKSARRGPVAAPEDAVDGSEGSATGSRTSG